MSKVMTVLMGKAIGIFTSHLVGNPKRKAEEGKTVD
jgi:hypothetical protein